MTEVLPGDQVPRQNILIQILDEEDTNTREKKFRIKVYSREREEDPFIKPNEEDAMSDTRSKPT